MHITTYSRKLGEKLPGHLNDPHDMSGPCSLPLQIFARKMGFSITQRVVIGDDNTITGHIFSFPCKLRHQGYVVEGVSGMDLFVFEQYRKYGHGLILMEDFFESINSQVFVAYGISAMAEPLYKFCKSTTTKIPELSLPIRSRCKLALSFAGRLRLFAPVVDVALWLHRQYLKTKLFQLKSLSVRELQDVPECVNDIVAADPHPYAELHDVRYLQALKDSAPDFHRCFYGVYHEEEMLGFYLTEVREKSITTKTGTMKYKVGRILEWETKDEERFPERLLILHALLNFQEKVDSVSVHVSESGVLDFLKHACKLRVKTYWNWGIRVGDESPYAKQADIRDISKWRTRTAMGDVGFF